MSAGFGVNMIQQYIDSFTKCYPQKKCEVKPAYNRQGMQIGYRVAINGDWGDLVLSESDMHNAIVSFNR